MSAIVGALRAVLSLESAAFTKGLSQAQVNLKNFDKRMKAIGGGMQKIGAGLSVVGAGVAAALGRALHQADDMGKAAQKFGVPVEELSRLAYAADLSDVSLETLGTGLKQLSVRMANSAASFKDVGVNVRDMNGNLRPTQDVLAEVADVFSRMPDGAEKTALAVRLLGKSGAEMIPLLNGGGQALRDMAAEADAMGLTITGDTVKAAETFNDNLSRLWKTLDGIAIQIAAALAPTLADLTNKAVALSKWFQNLSPETQQWAADIALMSVAAGPVLIALGALVKSLATLRVVLAGITALLAANPILVAIAAIAGAAYLIYQNWGPIKQFFVDLWNGVQAAADATYRAIADATIATKNLVLGAWDGLKAEFALRLDQVRVAFAELWEKIKALAKQWVADFLAIGGQIVDGLKRGIQEKWDEFVAYFDGLGQGMIDGWNKLWEINSPSRVMHEIGQFITAGLSDGLTAGIGGVQDAMGGVVGVVAGASDSLASALQDVSDWGRQTFSGLLQGTTTLGDALEGLRNKLIDTFANNAWDYLMQAISGGLGGGSFLTGGLGYFNANGNAFNHGRIAAFAKGGIVTGPTAFKMPSGLGIMGEAGPEAIMPLTRGANGRLGVQAAGGGGQVVINQVIHVETGVSQTVRAEMLGLLPKFKEQALSGVIEANRRGGAAMRGLA